MKRMMKLQHVPTTIIKLTFLDYVRNMGIMFLT